MQDELKIILEDEDTLELELQNEDTLDVESEIDTTEVVTSDYEKLNNLPGINDIQLIGNKSAKELKLQEEMYSISNLEIEEILKL